MNIDQMSEVKTIFRHGSSVRLNSGGPQMTVTSFNDDGTVDVVWFSDGINHRGRFHYCELVSLTNDLISVRSMIDRNRFSSEWMSQ